MKISDTHSPSFDEEQSLQVIKEMIQVSRQKLKSDGILFILWGWIMFIHYFILYAVRAFLLTNRLTKNLNLLVSILIPIGLGVTIYYLYKQHRRAQTYIGISLRYIWFSMFVCLVLINLIQYNVLHEINFELQHPIFMVVIAFAITVTGAIIRYKLIIAGGILFGISAYIASFLDLPDQLLIEAFAWLITFAIPGQILYAKRHS